jgi:hypothetical protein
MVTTTHITFVELSNEIVVSLMRWLFREATTTFFLFPHSLSPCHQNSYVTLYEMTYTLLEKCSFVPVGNPRLYRVSNRDKPSGTNVNISTWVDPQYKCDSPYALFALVPLPLLFSFFLSFFLSFCLISG